MVEFIEVILAIFITVICADFAVRVIRYAKTGRGGPEDPEAFFWWQTLPKIDIPKGTFDESNGEE